MKKIIPVLILLLLAVSIVHAEEIGTAKIGVPAVTPNGTGVMTSIEVEIGEGKGRVLLNTVPLTGIQTQNSERIAAGVAQNFTNMDFSDYDVIYTFRTEAYVIEGPSAGAAMAVATIAAAQGSEIRKDASITGTIGGDGSIGPVGGIIQKATAASEEGHKYFLIPEGEEMQPQTIEKVEQPAPGWTIVRTETVYINVTKYAEDNLDLSIIEVGTISEAVDIMIKGKNETVPPTITAPTQELVLEKIEISEKAGSMRKLAEKQIERANTILEEAEKEFESATNIEEIESFLEEMLEDARSELDKANTALDQNYLYGAANHGFKAAFNAKFVRDICKYNSFEAGEQLDFLGSRIAEATSNLNNTQEKLGNIEKLAQDKGAYEWAIAAQERLTAAEHQLSLKDNRTENILYNLAIAEEWASIAEDFHEVAQEEKTGEVVDISALINKTENRILRANAEVGQFAEESLYGSKWYLENSLMEYSKGWHLAAYIDASRAISRVEAKLELNIKSWDNIIEYIDAEIDKIETGDSIWGALYKDQAKLEIYYAQSDLDINDIRDALIYTREASMFSEIAEEVDELPSKEVSFIGKIPQEVWLLPLIILIIILIMVGFLVMERHYQFF